MIPGCRLIQRRSHRDSAHRISSRCVLSTHQRTRHREAASVPFAALLEAFLTYAPEKIGGLNMTLCSRSIRSPPRSSSQYTADINAGLAYVAY